MNKISASILLCGLVPLVGFGGVHAEAGAVAKEAGFVIDDMKGVLILSFSPRKGGNDETIWNYVWP